MPRATLDQSRRLAAVQTPVIPIVSRWIAETPGTISLGQGIVSYGPPPGAMAALGEFPASPADHRYGAVEGEPALLDAIAAKLARENATALDGRRVVVTAGSNLAFMNAILAVADPGDDVILLAPYYFNHDMAITMAGCRTVAVATTPSYQIDVAAVAAAIGPRTRAIVTVSPNNPTGAVYPEGDLRAINALAASRGLFHIHDEAYEYFIYPQGPAHFSPASRPDSTPHTIALYSLSKAYGFASWRIGYMVIPESLWDAVNKIQDTILICPPLVSQHVARAAIGAGAEYAQSHLAALDRMRRTIGDALNGVSDACEIAVPAGAFYYFVKVRTRTDAMTAAEQLVRRHRVAAIPGPAFGAHDGCFLRVSYGAHDEATAAEGARRLAEGIRQLAAL
jgi:aspartate/methionine/tyrosine aminotransferase